MTSQRQFAQKGQVYRQLDKILSAMKAFAYAEVRKLEGQMAAHQALLARYRGAIHRLTQLGQMPAAQQQVPLLILIGTERGFCGDINRRLLQRARQALAGEAAELVVLGSRLVNLFDRRELLAALDGASNAEEVEPLVESLLNQLLHLERPNLLLNTRLVFFDDREDRVEVSPLFLPAAPEPKQPGLPAGQPPLLYEPVEGLLARLVPEYVFSMIFFCVRSALLSENRRRLTHMDSATRHLGEISQQLALKANQFRQETVIQEIEAHVASQALATAGLQAETESLEQCARPVA